MDVGSAENAGAIFSRPIHRDSLELFQTILSIRPTWQGLFLQSCCISSIHGGQTWEVRKMQEQFSATPSMEIKMKDCFKITANCQLPTANYFFNRQEAGDQ
jgi:hypothetical protein